MGVLVGGRHGLAATAVLLVFVLTVAIIPRSGSSEPSETETPTPLTEQSTEAATATQPIATDTIEGGEPSATDIAETATTDATLPEVTVAPTETVNLEPPSAASPENPTPASGTETLPAGVGSAGATTPSCQVSPGSGVIGQRILFSCTGFRPGTVARVYWKGQPRSLTSFTANGEGAGSVRINVPAVEPGRWYARASDGAGQAASANFFVLGPSMTVSQITADGGETILVRLRGYAASETVAIRWYSTSGTTYSTLRTVIVSSYGQVSISITVPGRSASGAHKLEAAGTTSGYRTRAFVVKTPLDNFVEGQRGCNRIAFIFNVGVGYPLDAGVLDTLESHGVPATMFLMGWWADRNPDLARRLATDGYVISSHGNKPPVLTGRSDSDVIADIQVAEAAIERATGRPISRFFTPYADAMDERVRALVVGQGYTPVRWRVSAQDWSSTATEDGVYRRVVDNAYDGAIVEFHIDAAGTPQSTGRALPRIIATLRDRGYQFVTVPQMTLPCTATAASVERVGWSAPAMVLAERTVTRRARVRRYRPSRVGRHISQAESHRVQCGPPPAA